MDTDRLKQVMKEILEGLGAKSPLMLDHELGINRAQTNENQIRHALAAYLRARIGEAFDGVQINVDVVIRKIERLTGTVRIYHDIDVHVVHNTEAPAPLKITVPLSVPQSVGMFLGLQRYKPPVALPVLSDGQRELLAAVSVLDGGTAQKVLDELLAPVLLARLDDVLTSTAPLAEADRQKLRAKGLYTDSLLTHLNRQRT